ncbi:hypothetical protein ONZ45_g11027 [Pleurotus djamor]|nr:hypothetical protein ONZ45_g11027 [Pleurotus djamor]
MAQFEKLLDTILRAISKGEPFLIQQSLDAFLDQTPGVNDPFSSVAHEDFPRADVIQNEAMEKVLEEHRADTSLDSDSIQTVQHAILHPAIRARICGLFDNNLIPSTTLENVIHSDLHECSPEDLALINTAWSHLLRLLDMTYSTEVAARLASLFFPLFDVGLRFLAGDKRFEQAMAPRPVLKDVQPTRSKKKNAIQRAFTRDRVVDALKASTRRRLGSKSLKK